MSIIEIIIYSALGIGETIGLGLWVYFKFVVTNKLELQIDPNLKKSDYVKKGDKKIMSKEDYKNKVQEFKFDKLTDVLPTKWSKLTIIMLSEDKGATFLFRNFDTEYSCFRYKKGKYIIENDGIYTARNGSRIAVYIEGISVPLKASYVEKLVKTIKYIDIDGSEKTSTVQLIKGLRFDAKIFDTFSNREFAEIFTKSPKRTLEYLLIIFSIIALVIGAINSILIYYFR